MEPEELKSIFIAEALENQADLDRLFVQMEQHPAQRMEIETVFRVMHTLKANAAAMGYEAITEIAHALEDIFNDIRQHPDILSPELFALLYQANDKLKQLIRAVQHNQQAPYKGLLTRLKVARRQLRPSETPEEILPAKEPDSENTPDLLLSEYVQIPVKKLDLLLNLMGELSIEQDRIFSLISQQHEEWKRETSRLQRISAELKYSITSTRLVPVNMLFQKFHRILRDVAQAENKQVQLRLKGTEIEIDRNILHIISDALIHLVRNAVSHGIEPETQRCAVGKPSVGTITLLAKNERNTILIEVEDDGKGIDATAIKQRIIEKGWLSPERANDLPEEEIIGYIFEPGFSSAEKVSPISGRGVGMAVVRQATQKAGGRISLNTRLGQGTRFSISLPTSLAIKPVLLCKLRNTHYAVTLTHIEAVLSLSKQEIFPLGRGMMSFYANQSIPLLFLKNLLNSYFSPHQADKGLNQPPPLDESERLNVIVTANENRRLGLVVDQLLQKKDITEKKLKAPLSFVPLISGATLLGNGEVCLVLDIPQINDYVFRTEKKNSKTQLLWKR